MGRKRGGLQSTSVCARVTVRMKTASVRTAARASWTCSCGVLAPRCCVQVVCDVVPWTRMGGEFGSARVFSMARWAETGRERLEGEGRSGRGWTTAGGHVRLSDDREASLIED